MAWIESHQSLLTHRKTIRASAMLGISKHLLIGHLHALWWWGLDNAKDDGDLGPTQPVEIAEACGWPARKAEALVDALITAGFLDSTPEGMRLHNWYRYAGKLNEKRGKDRARKAKPARNSSGIPTEVAGTNLTNQPDQPTNQPDQPSAATANARIDALAASFARYGTVTAGTPDAIAYSVQDYSLEWVERAVRVGAGSAVEGRPGWNYVESILERWQKQGGPDDDKPRVQPGRQFAGGVRDTSANATERAEARLRA